MTSPKKSLRRFSKEFARKNLVSPAKTKKVPMDLAPSSVHSPASVGDGDVLRSDVPPKKITASYREPSPAEVYPNADAIESMVQDSHDAAIQEYGRAKNREAMAVFDAINPNRVDADLGASPAQVASHAGLSFMAAQMMRSGKK